MGRHKGQSLPDDHRERIAEGMRQAWADRPTASSPEGILLKLEQLRAAGLTGRSIKRQVVNLMTTSAESGVFDDCTDEQLVQAMKIASEALQIARMEHKTMPQPYGQPDAVWPAERNRQKKAMAAHADALFFGQAPSSAAEDCAYPNHPVTTGVHRHDHPGYGALGSDSDGNHGHWHEHVNDNSHAHADEHPLVPGRVNEPGMTQ